MDKHCPRCGAVMALEGAEDGANLLCPKCGCFVALEHGALIEYVHEMEVLAQPFPHGEDYYAQYCREHTDAEARAFLIDQCRKGDAAVETLAAQLAEARSTIRAYRRVLVECREKMGEVCEQQAAVK